MDTRNNTTSLRWTITGERGVMASGHWGEWPTITLPQGSYQLRIDGTQTGTYALRMLDLATAPVIESGALQSGTLNPGSAVQTWRFDAQAGERFYFDAQLDPQAEWRLTSPQGDQVWAVSAGTDRDTVLQQAGTWTLILNGYNNQSTAQNYRFAIHRQDDSVRDITLGQTVGNVPRRESGAPALNDGGSALAFDALRDVTVPHGPATDLRNDVTLEAWIHPDRYADTWTPIIVKDDASGDKSRTYSLWLNSQGFIGLGTADASGQQWIESAWGTVQLGQWTHVAGVIDRSGATPQLRLYVNGQLVKTGALRTTPAVSVAGPTAHRQLGRKHRHAQPLRRAHGRSPSVERGTHPGRDPGHHEPGAHRASGRPGIAPGLR
ncbi:MAG: LamG domain-containing protein [Aquabacterium sp.]